VLAKDYSRVFTGVGYQLVFEAAGSDGNLAFSFLDWAMFCECAVRTKALFQVWFLRGKHIVHSAPSFLYAVKSQFSGSLNFTIKHPFNV
jgi:hypothetical protein